MQPALVAWLPVGSGLAPIALARLGAMAVPFLSALAQPQGPARTIQPAVLPYVTTAIGDA